MTTATIDISYQSITWEQVAAAEWDLVDQHEEIFLYASDDFEGSLAVVFSDDETAIDLAQFVDVYGREWIWHYPEG